MGAEIRKFLESCTGNVSLKKDRQTHVHLMNPKAPITHRAWALPQAPFTLNMGGGYVSLSVSTTKRGGQGGSVPPSTSAPGMCSVPKQDRLISDNRVLKSSLDP